MPIDLDRPADHAVTGILLSNLFALAVVMLSGGGLLMLMWPFWAQSVVIGYFAQRRMRKLQQFTTAGMKINNQPVDATPETKSRTANFLVVHYGFFHLVYFFFLYTFTTAVAPDGMMAIKVNGRPETFDVGQIAGIDFLWIAIVSLGFVQSHRLSHLEHVEADLRGVPNLGTLMFLPYLRILPMHITIITGAVMSSGAGMLLFGFLKTLADLGMHKFEHKLLQSGTAHGSIAAHSSKAHRLP